MEEWKPVPGYEGYYEVSNRGRVRSVKRCLENSIGVKKKYPAVILRPQNHMKGYHVVWFWRSGNRTKVYIHRVVALAFHPNPENKEFVNHKDKDRQNNHCDNLEWCTIEENTQHRDSYNPDDPF